MFVNFNYLYICIRNLHNTIMTKSSVAAEFRAKHGPDVPTKTLARALYAEHPLLYKDVDDARSALRYIEGKHGRKDKRTANSTFSEFIKESPRPFNPYFLPKGDESEYVPYVIEGPARIAGFFDVHVPHHSLEALTGAIEWCKAQEANVLLIGGDFIDFYGLSRFAKDPNKRNATQEILMAVDVLKAIYEAIKPRKVIYKMGNHDERFEQYLWQKYAEIPQLTELEEFSSITLENVLRKRLGGDFPIEFVGDRRIVKAGNLNITHGHEFPSGIASPVNIARGLYLRAKANALCGHHHRSASHVETNINDEMVVTHSVGCLCDLHPLYMPINSWNHGVCLIELDEENKVYVHNKRIKNGRIM